jgi:hypothetical protein
VTDAATSLPEVFKQPGYNVPLDPTLPWYAVFGNHDGLIQGNAPIEPSFQDAAARSGRYFINQQDYIRLHFDHPDVVKDLRSFCKAGIDPADTREGRGFAGAGARLCDADPDNDAYYTFDNGPFHHIVLDTMNDDFVGANGYFGGYYPPGGVGAYAGGYAEGILDPAQFAWLGRDLEANKTRPIIVHAHHTVNSFVAPQGEAKNLGYVSGAELTAKLNAYPNAVFFIGGQVSQSMIRLALAAASWVGTPTRMNCFTPSRYGSPGMK